MRLAALFLFLSIMWSVAGNAQTDTISLKEPYADGIFLTYDDFRHQRQIHKSALVTSISTNYLDFYSRVLFEKELVVEEGGNRRKVPSAEVWGYFQNNILYLNYRGEFYRVPVFGTFSYFVATVLVNTPGFYDPRFGTTVSGGTTREIREFMMDVTEGRVKELTSENVRQVLSRDPQLWAEYSKLSRRKQKDQLYRYIRRYNEAHPVFVYPK